MFLTTDPLEHHFCRRSDREAQSCEKRHCRYIAHIGNRFQPIEPRPVEQRIDQPRHRLMRQAAPLMGTRQGEPQLGRTPVGTQEEPNVSDQPIARAQGDGDLPPLPRCAQGGMRVLAQEAGGFFARDSFPILKPGDIGVIAVLEEVLEIGIAKRSEKEPLRRDREVHERGGSGAGCMRC